MKSIVSGCYIDPQQMSRNAHNQTLLSPLIGRSIRLIGVLAILLVVLCSALPGLAIELALEVHDSFLWAEGNSLSAQGGLIVVGSPNGLRFFSDLHNGSFALVGEFKVSVGIRDCQLRDSIVYYTDNLGVASALDITDPGHPDDLGDFGPAEPVEALAASDDYLITAGSGKAVSYNLAAPRHPLVAGEWFYAGPTIDVAAKDSLVLITQGADGMASAIRHPDGSLAEAGRFQIPDPAPGFPIDEVATNGRYAWVPHGANGVLVVDFADPYHPHSTSQIVTYGLVQHVSLAGDRLLVADASFGLISYWLIVPEVPYWQSEVSDVRTLTALWPESGNRFYATEGTDMFALDIAPLGGVTVGGHLSQPGSFSRWVRHGDLALLPDAGGMWLCDGLTADADSAYHRIVSGRPVFEAVRVNNRLFSAEGQFGVAIRSIDAFGNLGTLRVIPPGRAASTGVSVTRDTLIVVENGEGFQIYDITNPFNPDFLGRSRLSRTFAASIQPASRYVYLSEENGPVDIFDLRFPAKPSKIGSLPGVSSVQQLTIEGKTLYTASPSEGVAVFDISSPASPALVHIFPAPASATAFYRSGRTLYTGDGNGHIAAIDIADPANTPVISSADVIGSITSIRKFRERLWVATDAAVYAVDVVPPLLLGDVNADGHADALDLVTLIDYLFANGTPPYRPNVADMNGDGRSNLVDLVRLISYIFRGGPPLDQGTIE